MVNWPALLLVAAGIFAVNLPFGYWRAGLRKLSAAWFVAIHAPVPVAVGLRWVAHVPFRWALLPIFVAAYFAGQLVGARIGRARQGRSTPSAPPRGDDEAPPARNG